MRQPRIKLNQSETFYHVMTRTAQQAFYLDDAHTPGFKNVCRNILEAMAKIYYVEIFAWVFMDNHVHICCSVKQPEVNAADVERRFETLQNMNVQPRKWHDYMLKKQYERFTDLSMFMWDVNRRIAVAHNKRKGTKGHLWGERFKSKVIEDEESLLRVMSYIEQNPVRAGMCEKPSDYEHSSSGTVRKLMERGEEKSLHIPAVGFLKKFNAPERAEVYIKWMDAQAKMILNPEAAQNPDETIKPYCLTPNQLAFWKKDFDKSGPSDWRTQGYGSPEFQAKIAVLQKKRRLALARTQYPANRIKNHNSDQKEITRAPLRP